ncbi:MAG: WbqC family protein [Bacteroidota bacterium]
MEVILGTAYWPNLSYFYCLLNHNCTIDKGEHYTKQSFKNRATILTANGVQNLIIPVQKFSNHTPVHQIKLCYKEKWQTNHYRSIYSAYKNSPYFDYFENELRLVYNYKPEYLHEFNDYQIKTLFSILKLKKDIKVSQQYIENSDLSFDLRNEIHPKNSGQIQLLVDFNVTKPYYQTFQAAGKFEPNLSILDILFNCGLETKSYFINSL